MLCPWQQEGQDDGVVEGRGQGGGLEGFRFYRLGNTLNVGFQNINLGCEQVCEVMHALKRLLQLQELLESFTSEVSKFQNLLSSLDLSSSHLSMWMKALFLLRGMACNMS